MKKEMLINVLQPEECRIAIVEDGVLEELYVERASQESYVGNIYKGRIVNIEPSIQAVFVDFGIGRNGFLHVSDVDPAYYRHLLPKEILAELEAEERDEERRERGDRGDPGRDRERNRDRDDRPPPRVTAPESAVTVPPRPPITPIGFVEDADESDFGAGLADDDEPTPDEPTPRPIAETPPPLPEAEDDRPEVVELTPAEPTDDDDFGAGLDLQPPRPTAETPPPLPVVEPAEPEDSAPESETEKPARGRSRSRSRAKKADEPTEGGDEAEAKKARPRRTRKKADAEGEDTPPSDDAGPRPMPGSERRTSPDDEPEIQPFFDGASDDFDVEGPNDRFGSAGDDDDTTEPSDTGFADTDDGPDVESVADAPAVAAEESDDDEFHYTPPAPRDDRGRGRDRGGPSGGGNRSRDRGPGRDRDRRGGPGGDRRGGPGGRSGGPPRDRVFPKIPIQEIFKRGQEVIIQVIKEGIGTKGPTLSTFVSIAGRYLVLMPSLNRVGVSRKIEDPDARRRLREIMTALKPPKGVGFIVRTAAVDRNETELQNDLAYLLRLWQVVVRRIKRMPTPVEIYRESDMITRTIRDNFTADIDTIWVDEPTAFAHASEFLQIVMPRYADRIRHHDGSEPLFNKYRVEDEIAKINHKRIEMPQGGSIIIEQTEALVAIDVNSGNFRAENNAEETAFQMNLIAAKEIARQLRLRDLGGVIVNDFIDMRDEKHRRRVEDAMRDALKRDKARTKVLRISQFGIIEMTRQRIQPSLKKRIFNDCPHCKGTGYVKNQETMGIEVMRLLQLAAHRAPAVTAVTLTVHPDVAFYLLNRKRKEIAAIEANARMEVQIHGQAGASPEHLDVRCHDGNGNEVRLFGPPPRMFRGGGPGDRGRFQDRRPPALD